MSIPHPLLSSPPDAISVEGQTLSKGKPVTIPWHLVTDRLRALEKASVIKIIKRDNKAVLIKL